MVAAGGLGAVWVVGEKVLDQWLGLRDTATGVEQLQDKIRTWERGFRLRRRGLDQRMTIVEHAVAHAEDSARQAVYGMREFRGAFLRSMEDVEQRTELEVLIAQGRIPSEHLSN
jgi:hypothetical protein